MEKSILVIDTPENCIDCHCHFTYDNGQVWCGKKDKELLEDDIETFKPDWCPLQDIPEKKSVDGLDRRPLLEAQFVGWNDCLDQILNGG